MSHSHAIPDRASLPPARVEEVADRVFAFVQPDGSWCLNNTGFVAGTTAVVAVDTCATEARSRRFLDEIATVTPAPLRTLVNTHHHGDHTHGNWLVPPAVTIVGHERCRDEVIASGHVTANLFPGVEFGRIDVTPPTLTFTDRITIWADDLAMQCLHLGPAHTTNDVVVWLEDQRVLFTGDLVFNGGTPFALQGSLTGWLAALDDLRSLDAEVVVPGHGDVCTPAVFDDVAAYLRFVLDLAGRVAADDVDPLEAARSTDLGDFAGWCDPERLVGNLHRALADLAHPDEPGRPIDYGAALGGMITYNGGQPLRCLA